MTTTTPLITTSTIFETAPTTTPTTTIQSSTKSDTAPTTSSDSTIAPTRATTSLATTTIETTKNAMAMFTTMTLAKSILNNDFCLWLVVAGLLLILAVLIVFAKNQ